MAALQTGDFERDGFIAPVDVLTPAQARLVGRYFDDKAQPKPLRWHKGVAAADHLVYEIATLPHLLQRVIALLGPDVVLWGASVVDRKPGEAHPWHSDIETSAPDARSVTAWIGLENTSAESALNVIPGSHRFGESLQQTAVDCGIPVLASCIGGLPESVGEGGTLFSTTAGADRWAAEIERLFDDHDHHATMSRLAKARAAAPELIPSVLVQRLLHTAQQVLDDR